MWLAGPGGRFTTGHMIELNQANAQLKAHGFTGGLTGYEQLSSGGGDNSGPSVLEETLLGVWRVSRRSSASSAASRSGMFLLSVICGPEFNPMIRRPCADGP